MQTLFPTDLQQFSRREFLSGAAKGLAAFFLIPVLEHFPSVSSRLDRHSQGRILSNNVSLYKKPSFSSEIMKMYWKDLVLPITGVTIGDKEPDYNRIWYQMNGEGYCHSGSIQPVNVAYHSPVDEVPENGFLAEVCVPFTDAIWYLTQPDYVAYRLYYSSTHWVTGIFEDADGKKRYRLKDDKWFYHYFVDATHMRPLKAGDIAPISPRVSRKGKKIEIRRDEQVIIAYEYNRPVFMAKTATGAKFSDGDFTTPTGHYITNRKRPSRHMAAGDHAAPNSYDLPGVPWVSYLTKSGIAIHGTYWHNDFGKPRSHGCINVTSEASLWLYRWTTPFVPIEDETWTDETGTNVEVI